MLLDMLAFLLSLSCHSISLSLSLHNYSLRSVQYYPYFILLPRVSSSFHRYLFQLQKVYLSYEYGIDILVRTHPTIQYVRAVHTVGIRPSPS
ncbi:hypothetical protein R3P38DRAFT_2940353 [Favolaschia claudopus]|uniref:Secreted protein n=1 Tax=Favolaschia claudopus TaxID=2862362 RepID=A0AAW0BMQ1_9AGAR